MNSSDFLGKNVDPITAPLLNFFELELWLFLFAVVPAIFPELECKKDVGVLELPLKMLFFDSIVCFRLSISSFVRANLLSSVKYSDQAGFAFVLRGNDVCFLATGLDILRCILGADFADN